jgi:hypothetical protein
MINLYALLPGRKDLIFLFKAVHMTNDRNDNKRLHTPAKDADAKNDNQFKGQEEFDSPENATDARLKLESGISQASSSKPVNTEEEKSKPQSKTD